jgi:hypothetical protein
VILSVTQLFVKTAYIDEGVTADKNATTVEGWPTSVTKQSEVAR